MPWWIAIVVITTVTAFLIANRYRVRLRENRRAERKARQREQQRVWDEHMRSLEKD